MLVFEQPVQRRPHISHKGLYAILIMLIVALIVVDLPQILKVTIVEVYHVTTTQGPDIATTRPDNVQPQT